MLSKEDILSRVHTVSDDGKIYVFNKPPRIAAYTPSATSTRSFQSYVQEHVDPSLHAVHAIDRDTTGLLIFGATASSRRALSNAFANRTVRKEYAAIVHGPVNDVVSACCAPLDVKNIPVQVSLDGKMASTGVSIISANKDNSYAHCRLNPKTGYTHQIRAHLAGVMRAPIVGDSAYYHEAGDKSYFDLQDLENVPSRYFLHARRVGFTYKGRAYDLEAPLEDDMEEFLVKVGLN